MALEDAGNSGLGSPTPFGRVRTARAIYGYPALSRYALGTHPPIHIVVKNGNVKLEGVVANSMDRDLAYLRANGIPGAFSVTNDLRIDNN